MILLDSCVVINYSRGKDAKLVSFFSALSLAGRLRNAWSG